MRFVFLLFCFFFLLHFPRCFLLKSPSCFNLCCKHTPCLLRHRPVLSLGMFIVTSFVPCSPLFNLSWPWMTSACIGSSAEGDLEKCTAAERQTRGRCEEELCVHPGNMSKRERVERIIMLWLLLLECQVCHEVFGQEEDQDEAGGDSSTQRENHAVISQHRGESLTPAFSSPSFYVLHYFNRSLGVRVIVSKPLLLFLQMELLITIISPFVLNK